MATKPTKSNLTVYQGSVFLLELTHTDADGDVPAVDVSSVEMQFRESVISSSPQLTVGTATGEVTVTDGLITIEIPAATTSAISLSTSYSGRVLQWVYDLEVTYSDGRTERLLEGDLFFSREVTR